MRPPICAICGKRFFDTEKGGLVYFAKRKSDKKFAKKLKKKGFVGHPTWAEWYCEKHYPEAKKLSHLTIDKAREKLSEIFSEN